MSAAVEKEPTMEEILASIRRIISEDGAGEDVSEPQTSDVSEELAIAPEPVDSDPYAASSDEFEPDPESGPEPEPASDIGDDEVVMDDAALEDDVLELTEFAEPETGSDPFPIDDDMTFGEGDPDDGALVSEPTEHQAGASFAELSAMLVGGYEGAGNTLEGLVRDMLKPMLRAWLDENLPRIVEDMVEREIARIAARKGRK